MNILIIRYSLDCSLHKLGDSYRIYIKRKSMPTLCSIVKPYMIKSIEYKIKEKCL